MVRTMLVVDIRSILNSNDVLLLKQIARIIDYSRHIYSKPVLQLLCFL
jgi:hypothetical protein